MTAAPAPAATPSQTLLANGRIDGEHVLVKDASQAGRLHSRGSVGQLRPDGALQLALVEAAYSLAEGRLAVVQDGKALGLADVLALGAGVAGGHRTETEYLVYRDLRERGLVVRPAGAARFAVWPRGTDQGSPAFHATACSDADGLDATLLASAATAKELLSVADADGTVTHYQAGTDRPAGDVPQGDLPRAKGAVLADRVLVTEPLAVAAYAQREFLGTRQGATLFLSFVEAESLRRRGVLSVPTGLLKGDEPQQLLEVHLALRSAGAVPKSGFKFGTHLRAYRGAPDDGHAEWLVHCADPTGPLPWSALSRGVRLAHGVRKKFLVAIPSTGADGALLFAHLAWFRP